MEDLRIENTEQPIEQVGEKGKVSDIIVSIENKTLILEMNQFYYEGIVEKNLRYMTNIQNKSLKEGESYRSLKKVS